MPGDLASGSIVPNSSNQLLFHRIRTAAAGLNAAAASISQTSLRRGRRMALAPVRPAQMKNRTDWDLRPIMSCQMSIAVPRIRTGTYHSLVRRIQYALCRQVFWLRFNALNAFPIPSVAFRSKLPYTAAVLSEIRTPFPFHPRNTPGHLQLPTYSVFTIYYITDAAGSKEKFPAASFIYI